MRDMRLGCSRRVAAGRSGNALTMTATARIGADDLGIDLTKPTDGRLFKWLVACSLFGARIRQELAAGAYRELDRAKVLTPDKLAGTDWQRLVDLLGAGGYKRYDESTARQLIALGAQVRDDYGNKLSRLRDGATTKRELKRRLQQFTGIGPTAADISCEASARPGRRNEQMRRDEMPLAVRFDDYGDLDVLRLEEVPTPEARSGRGRRPRRRRRHQPR